MEAEGEARAGTYIFFIDLFIVPSIIAIRSHLGLFLSLWCSFGIAPIRFPSTALAQRIGWRAWLGRGGARWGEAGRGGARWGVVGARWGVGSRKHHARKH